MTVLLTACSTAPANLDPEALIPKALTTCADEPAVPPRPAPGQPRTDEVKAEYTVAVLGFGKSCKGTVNAIAVRRAALDAQAHPVTKGGWFHFPKIF